jgi:hypothetical protein
MLRDSLVEVYLSKSDDELLSLAADPGSLIEEARPILAEELGRRGLIVAPELSNVLSEAKKQQVIALGRLPESGFQRLAKLMGSPEFNAIRTQQASGVTQKRPMRVTSKPANENEARGR